MTKKVIEFPLESAKDDSFISLSIQSLMRRLILITFANFKKEYNIPYDYKTTDDKLIVWFDNDKDYTLFFLVTDIEKFNGKVVEIKDF